MTKAEMPEIEYPPLPADATPRLNAALAKAMGQIEGAKKDSENPGFKREVDGKMKASTYADLASVITAIRAAFAANEIAYPQTTHCDVAACTVTVTTHLRHSSGEAMASDFTVPVLKKDPQGFGSATTYARRFGLMAAAGVAPEDDDGNSNSSDSKVSGVKQEHKPAKPKSEPTPETLAFDAEVAKNKEREAARQKLIAKFAEKGVNAADLTRKLGHSPDVISNPEWEMLRQYFKDISVDAEEAARLEVQRQAEASLSMQAPAAKGTPAKVFEGLIDRIRKAATEVEAIQIGAEFPEHEKSMTPGDIKALKRAYTDRILVLQDAARRQPPPTPDVPF